MLRELCSHIKPIKPMSPRLIVAVTVWTSVIAASALPLAGAAQADAIIDTSPYWPGTSHQNVVGEWGVTTKGLTTYGQTITAPLGETNLTSFEFLLAQSNNPINYRAYVYAWDPASRKITGSALFTSDVLTLPVATGFRLVEISGVDARVTGGESYVLFLSTAGVSNLSNATAYWGYCHVPFNEYNPYTGGTAVFTDNFTTGPWTTPFAVQDLAFRARFSAPAAAVPEPGTLALLALGACPLVGMMVRRRRSH